MLLPLKHITRAKFRRTFDSVFATYQTMQNSIIKERLKFIKPDICIKPEIYDVRVLDFVA